MVRQRPSCAAQSSVRPGAPIARDARSGSSPGKSTAAAVSAASASAGSASAGLVSAGSVSVGQARPPEAGGEDLDEVRWRLLLCGSTPREVLARIVRDDPLRLRKRIGRRLVERSLLLDADRVLLRALAHVAHASARYQGRPELAAWLVLHVDRAIDECVREPEPAAGVHAQLAPPLQLDPSALVLACRAFNQLDDEVRAAFFRTVLGRAGGAAASGSELAAARAARIALEQLLAPFDAAAPAVPPAKEVRRGR